MCDQLERHINDVTKILSTKLLILLRFYFHDVQGQLKTVYLLLLQISLQMGSWFGDRLRSNF